MSDILVTGAAGFIGYHTVSRLCGAGADVVGVDNFDPYYDPSLKRARLAAIRAKNFQFLECDLRDRDRTLTLARSLRPHTIVHLAAQAGVRYSVAHPQRYIDTNVTGFLNVLDAARECGAKQLIYASSSSVYGATMGEPCAERADTSRPVSMYAAKIGRAHV